MTVCSVNHYNDKFKGIAFVEIKYCFDKVTFVCFYRIGFIVTNDIIKSFNKERSILGYSWNENIFE